jgi:hypothetical protein
MDASELGAGIYFDEASRALTAQRRALPTAQRRALPAVAVPAVRVLLRPSILAGLAHACPLAPPRAGEQDPNPGCRQLQHNEGHPGAPPLAGSAASGGGPVKAAAGARERDGDGSAWVTRGGRLPLPHNHPPKSLRDRLRAPRSSAGRQDDCATLVSSVDQLQDTVGRYLAAVDQQAERVEAEKLRAVGLRNRVAALHEVRGRPARRGSGRASVPWSQGSHDGSCRRRQGRPHWRTKSRAEGLPNHGASHTRTRASTPARTRRSPRAQERRRRRQELLQLLQEKQSELDRLEAEEESLRRVRQEQEAAIAKLSNPAGLA